MGSDQNLACLEQQLSFALYSCSKAIISTYQPFLKRLNLTYPQYLVYMVLDEKTQVSVGELGNKLNLKTGTLTPLLKRMEAAELVERNRTKDDERWVFVKLTKKAIALKPEIVNMQKEVTNSVTGIFSKAFGQAGNDLNSFKENVKTLDAQLREM